MLVPQLLYRQKKVMVAMASCSLETVDYIYYEISRDKEEYRICNVDPQKVDKSTSVVLLVYGTAIITKISSSDETPFEELIPINRRHDFTKAEEISNGFKVTCFAPTSVAKMAKDMLPSGKLLTIDFAASFCLEATQWISNSLPIIYLPGIVIQNHNGGIHIDTSIESKDVQLGNEHFSEIKMAAYLAGIKVLSYTIHLALRYPKELEYQLLKRSIYRIYAFLLLVIFGVLLINYFNLNSLSCKYPMVESEVSSLQIRIASANAQIKSLGIERSNINLTIYSDRIGVITPQGITLSRLAFSPIEGQVESGDISEIKSGVVEIAGISSSSAEIDELLNRIKKEKWALTPTLSDLSYSNEKKQYQFTITSKIK